MYALNEKMGKELEIIKKQNGGILRPDAVIEYARNKKSALHGRFIWDDTKAAHQYRLTQARDIIRVAVIVESNTSQPVRAYVSLSDERGAEGGYRAIAQVMDDKLLRERLLADCYSDLVLFRKKYAVLAKIATMKPLFKAINAALPQPKKTYPRRKLLANEQSARA